MKSSTQNNRQKLIDKTRDTVVFAMLGGITFVSYLLMQGLPNIHLVGMFTMVFTLVYRKRALAPIYVYVMLSGLINGFGIAWIPYIYIWTILWGVTMLLPKNMPRKIAYVVYPVVCALHGLLFGLLYLPAQVILFNLSYDSAIAWLLAGLSFDALHAAGNFVFGFLIIPLCELLKKLDKVGRI